MQTNLLYTIIALLCMVIGPVYAQETKSLDPVYVKIITSPYEQYNDIHPTWSSNGDIISFERYDAKTHEIILSDINGNKLQSISITAESTFNLDELLGETSTQISYNSGISWAPDNKKFVFTSNGKFNNFDLYIGKPGETQKKRLTFHQEKDAHANWSSDGRYICFISARNGWAELYNLDMKNGEVVNLISRQQNAFYPVWSPDSNKIALMLEVDDVFQIVVIDDIKKPNQSLRTLTQTTKTSSRPSWSKDGKKIAFYHQSSLVDEEILWNIIVVDAMRDKPLMDEELQQNKVADNVVINSETGPTWVPDSNFLAYVKNENQQYNPIHLVNVVNKEDFLLNTNTMMNKDLSCSDQGLLAFQTQDRQWSRIFIAKLPELNRDSAVDRSKRL